jgi:glutaredoxin
VNKPKATVYGRTMCIVCQTTAAQLRELGYDVEELDIVTDIDAAALFAERDGDPDSLPYVELRGVPKGGL